MYVCLYIYIYIYVIYYIFLLLTDETDERTHPLTPPTLFSSTNDTLTEITFNLEGHNVLDISLFLDTHQEDIKCEILKILSNLNIYSCKLYTTTTLNIERETTLEGISNVEQKHHFLITRASLYTMNELDTFISDTKEHICQRLENSEKELEGSGWRITGVSGFKIHLCRFAKGVLGTYAPYPRGVRGSSFIFNPNTSENCVLIALASYRYFRENTHKEPCYVRRLIGRRKSQFWRSRIQIGNLDPANIGWESLSQLEKLNGVKFIIY